MQTCSLPTHCNQSDDSNWLSGCKPGPRLWSNHFKGIEIQSLLLRVAIIFDLLWLLKGNSIDILCCQSKVELMANNLNQIRHVFKKWKVAQNAKVCYITWSYKAQFYLYNAKSQQESPQGASPQWRCEFWPGIIQQLSSNDDRVHNTRETNILTEPYLEILWIWVSRRISLKTQLRWLITETTRLSSYHSRSLVVCLSPASCWAKDKTVFSCFSTQQHAQGVTFLPFPLYPLT